MGLVALEMEIVTPNILFLKNQKDQIKRERLWKNATDRTSMTKRKIIKYPIAWKEKQKRFKEATEYDITVQYPLQSQESTKRNITANIIKTFIAPT